MKKFIALLIGLIVILASIVLADSFTKTYNVPTRKDRVKNDREAIARLSTDFDALIAHYNLLRTSTTYGYVPIPLSSWREVDTSGDVGDATADGGVLRSDTTPIYKSHTTGGTYKAQTIQWAASNSDPIAVSIPIPGDLDTDASIDLLMDIGNDGTTDSQEPVISFYWNSYGTAIDVTTDALDTTTDTIFSAYNVTLGASDVTTDARSLTIIITPGAHTTNALYLSRTQLRYTRSF